MGLLSKAFAMWKSNKYPFHLALRERLQTALILQYVLIIITTD